jgi:hypothetical protein
MDRSSSGLAVWPNRLLQWQGVQAQRRGGSGNHYAIETREAYWISGIKKNGRDRHWAGSGKITIEASAVNEYLEIAGETQVDLSRFVISNAILPTDPSKFHDVENERSS